MAVLSFFYCNFSDPFGSLRKNRFSKDGVAIKVQLCYDKSNNT